METLLRAGLSNAVCATVLALLVAGLSRPLARRPAILHGLWLLVLLKLVTPPIYELAIPWPIPASPAEDPLAQAAVIRIPSEDVVLVEAGSVLDDLASIERPGEEDAAIGEIRLSRTPARLAPASPVTRLPIDWRRWTGTVWLAGTLVVLAVSCRRIRRFHRLVCAASPATGEEWERVETLASLMELRRVPEVCWIRARVSPLVWSLGRRPRLIIPQELWKTLDERKRSALVVHELAHLKRGDHLVRYLELLVTALYWWHPLIWWIRQSLRDAEEQCCDAWVVWAFPDAAKSYAETLLDTLEFIHRSDQPEPLLASGLGKVAHLRRRLTMIMTGTTFRVLGVRGTLGLFALAGFMLPVGATWAQKAEEKEEVRIVVKTDDITAEPIPSEVTLGELRIATDVAAVEPSADAKVVILSVNSQDKPASQIEVSGSIDDVIKQLEAQIVELKKGANPTESAGERIKALGQALEELKKAKDTDKVFAIRNVELHKVDDVKAARAEKDSPEIIKARQEVFNLRVAMEAKLKELQAAQAKIRELGGDPGDEPVLQWRRLKGSRLELKTNTISKPVQYTFARPVQTAKDLKTFAFTKPVHTAKVEPSAEQKAQFKKLMDDALAAYANGRYEEAAALAAKAAAVHPKETAARVLELKALTEQRFQVDGAKAKPKLGEATEHNRIEILEARLKALQAEIESLKKGSGSDAPKK